MTICQIFLKHLFATIPAQMRLKWGNFLECAPSLQRLLKKLNKALMRWSTLLSMVMMMMMMIMALFTILIITITANSFSWVAHFAINQSRPCKFEWSHHNIIIIIIIIDIIIIVIIILSLYYHNIIITSLTIGIQSNAKLHSKKNFFRKYIFELPSTFMRGYKRRTHLATFVKLNGQILSRYR